MIHIKETFAITCERDGCNVCDTRSSVCAGVIAYDLTVKDLTDPKLLRKLLSKIEEHYASNGYCTLIAEMEEEAEAERADERMPSLVGLVAQRGRR